MRLHALIAFLALFALALSPQGGSPQPAVSGVPIVVDVSDALGVPATMTLHADGRLVFQSFDTIVWCEIGESREDARNRFILAASMDDDAAVLTELLFPDGGGCVSIDALAAAGLTFRATWKSGGVTHEVIVEREAGESDSSARQRFVEQVKAAMDAFPPEVAAPAYMSAPPPPHVPAITPYSGGWGDVPPRLEPPMGAV